MINVKELRIGNFVMMRKEKYLLDPSIYKSQYVQITSVPNGEYLHWRCATAMTELGGKVLSGQKYSDTNPIPLTPEILKSCGFEFEDMADLGTYIHFKISHPDLFLSYSSESGSIWIGEFDTKNKHLHQLQNLYFALTGNELEVKFPAAKRGTFC